MTWKDAYTPPFKNWQNIGVHDAKGRKVADFLHLTQSPNSKDNIVSILNGDKQSSPRFPVTHKDGFILHGEARLLRMRGWGYLTGIGGLNLDESTAAQIQDSMADYIVDKLNNKA